MGTGDKADSNAAVKSDKDDKSEVTDAPNANASELPNTDEYDSAISNEILSKDNGTVTGEKADSDAAVKSDKDGKDKDKVTGDKADSNAAVKSDKDDKSEVTDAPNANASELPNTD